HSHSQPTLFPYTTLFRSPGNLERRDRSAVSAFFVCGDSQYAQLGETSRAGASCRRDRSGALDRDDGGSAASGAEHEERRLAVLRSEEHTSELQSRFDLVC